MKNNTRQTNKLKEFSSHRIYVMRTLFEIVGKIGSFNSKQYFKVDYSDIYSRFP